MNARSQFACLATLLLSWLFILSPTLAQDPKVDPARENPAIKPTPRKDKTGAPDAKLMARHEGFVKIAKKGGIDLLLIGDSITDNWNSPMRGKAIYDKVFAPLKAANFGIGADRTEHVLWRLQNGELDGFSPKVIMLMIGTNNINAKNPLVVQDVSEGITAVVKTIRDKSPTSKILLLGVFPRGETPDSKLREIVNDVNKTIAKLDDGKFVHFMDINPKFLESDGTLSKTKFPDLLHPNPEGHQIWADAVLPTIHKMMGVAVTAPGADEKKENTSVKPVARDANWVKRHEGFVNIAKKGDVDVLFMGDSITDAWRSRGKAIFENTFVPLKTANFGIGGDRTEHVLWRLQNGELDGIHPKVMVLLIGTNNIGNKDPDFDTPEQAAEGVKAVVDYTRNKRPDTKILLLAVFPRNDKQKLMLDLPAKVDQINTIISKLDDGKHVFYLDINKKLLEPDGTLSTRIMPDLLHPNTEGYQIWTDAMLPKLNELLGSAQVNTK